MTSVAEQVSPNVRVVGRTRRAAVDDVIIAALAAGRSQADAAQMAGVSRKTVERRVKDPAFLEAVDVARGDLLGRTLDVLSAGALEGAMALRVIVLDKEQPAAARVSAARALLSGVLAWRDQFELAERVDRLERMVTLRSVQ
jgi:hypothetical protein